MNYRETPCEKCGWKFPGFHVCIDLSAPVDPKVQQKHDNRYATFRTAAWSNQSRRVATERWARYREETAERDQGIIAEYKTGEVSMKELSRKHGIAFQTLRNMLIRASDRGELVLRPHGQNIRQRSS